jgi:hypothetical protein
MSTSNNKIVNKRSKDPIERMIFERGLRIAQVLPVKKQDSLIVFLNNKKTMHVRLSGFERLKKATQAQLDKWELIGGGVGIHWPVLDEDLSLKGLINQLVLENTLKVLDGPGDYNFAMAA